MLATSCYASLSFDFSACSHVRLVWLPTGVVVWPVEDTELLPAMGVRDDRHSVGPKPHARPCGNWCRCVHVKHTQARIWKIRKRSSCWLLSTQSICVLLVSFVSSHLMFLTPALKITIQLTTHTHTHTQATYTTTSRRCTPSRQGARSSSQRPPSSKTGW